MRDGVRRISQVSDICGMEGEVITMNDVAAFEFEGRTVAGNDHRQIPIRQVHVPRSRPGWTYFGLENAWMEALQSI